MPSAAGFTCGKGILPAAASPSPGDPPSPLSSHTGCAGTLQGAPLGMAAPVCSHSMHAILRCEAADLGGAPGPRLGCSSSLAAHLLAGHAPGPPCLAAVARAPHGPQVLRAESVA